MRNHLFPRYCVCALIAACLGLAVIFAAARPVAAFQFSGVPGQDQALNLGGQQAQLGEGDRVPKMEAGFTKPNADGAAQLFIVATMPEGAHTYSITQPEGGPIRSKIKVDSSTQVPTIGKFHTVGKPKVSRDDNIFPGVPMEEQSGKVKWFAPIKLAAGTNPQKVKIEGKVLMQLCDDNGCAMPKDYAFTAKYQPDVAPEKEPPADPPKEGAKKSAPPAKSASPSTKFSIGGAGTQSLIIPRSHAPLGTGDRVPKLDAGFTAPGPDGSAQLFVSVTLPPGANTYSLTQRQPGPKSSIIRIEPTAEVASIGAFAAITPPETKFNNDAFPGVPLEEYTRTVKWVAPIRFAPGAHTESTRIAGEAIMQLCEEDMGCIPARGYPFTASYRADVAPVKGLAAEDTAKAVLNEVETKPAANAGKEINWLPFTTVADLRTIVNPASFDIDQIRENVRRQNTRCKFANGHFLGLFGRTDLKHHAVRAAGDRTEDSLLCAAVGT